MTTTFEEMMRDPEFKKGFAIEEFIAETAQLIWELMERKELKQADLARLLGKSPAYVSQLLNGKANMTVKTLAEVVYVLGATVKLRSSDESSCEKSSQDSRIGHRFHLSMNHETEMKRDVFRFCRFDDGRISPSKKHESGNHNERVA